MSDLIGTPVAFHDDPAPVSAKATDTNLSFRSRFKNFTIFLYFEILQKHLHIQCRGSIPRGLTFVWEEKFVNI